MAIEVRGTEVVLSGEVDIDAAANLKDILLKIIGKTERHETITVTTRAVVRVDLAIVQLLCSSKQTLAEMGRKLLLTLPSSAFEKTLQGAGLSLTDLNTG